VPDVLRLRHGIGPTPSSISYPVTLCHIPAEQHLQFDSCESFWNTQFRYFPSLFRIPIGLLLHGGLIGLPGNQAVKAVDRVVDINRCPTISVCWVLGGDVYIPYIWSSSENLQWDMKCTSLSCLQTRWCTFYRFRYFICGLKEKEYPKEYWIGNQCVGETEETKEKMDWGHWKRYTDNGNKRVEKIV
jgi:hypothetical protein